MAKQIHYELFVRRGASPGWSLQEANESRAEIMAAAEKARASGFATGVKVMKETYDEATGDFLSLRIFEDGARSFKISKAAEDLPPLLPCLTPEDFYTVHARATLTRLLADTLARWKVTITELIHRADLLERLEATGTLFQHAVQKIAIARASGGAEPLAETIRALTDLADRAIARVYREQRSGRVVTPSTVAELNAYADAKAGQEGDGFLIGLAFAAYLRPAAGWSDKLARALDVIAAPPETPRAADMLSALADAVIGETLAGSAALQELLGPADDLGSALIAMSDLYLGRVPAAAPHAALSRLAAFFAADGLLDARTALARRVLAELKTHKRLAAAVAAELAHLRAVASRLVLGPSRLVPHEDIVAAVTLRSRHLVQSAPIADYLNGADPLVRIDRLLAYEVNIVGAENKRRIWDYLKPALTAAAFETALAQHGPPLSRLARAAALQAAFAKSALPEALREEGMRLVDAAAHRAVDLPRLGAGLADPAALAQMANAYAAGHIPKGVCTAAIAGLLKKAARAA